MPDKSPGIEAVSITLEEIEKESFAKRRRRKRSG
jgi:hypothetical protein